MPAKRTLEKHRKMSERAKGFPAIRHTKAIVNSIRIPFALERLVAGQKINLSKPGKKTRIVLPFGKGGSKGTLDLFIHYSDRIQSYFNKKTFLFSSPDIARAMKNCKNAMMVNREIPEAHKGKGIGTALLLRAQRIFEKRDLDLIYAFTTPDNTAAIRTYEKNGWVFLGKDIAGNVSYGVFSRTIAKKSRPRPKRN